MHKSLGLILVIGLILRLLLVIINIEIATLPQGGGDAKVFERKAWDHAQFGGESLSYYLRSTSDFIVLPGSLIYSVTGRNPYALALVMVSLGLWMIFLTYRAALELWGDARIASRVAWAAALFPSLVLHSAMFLREIPVSLCLAGAALYAIRYVKRYKLQHIGGFLCWIGVGSFFHSGVIFAIPAFVLGVMVTRPSGSAGGFKVYATNAIAALILAGAIFVANETGFGLGKFHGSLDEMTDQFEAQELRGTRGDAAYPESLRIRGGLSDAWKIPVRFVALIFSPLVPFMVRGPSHILGIVDAGLYFFLFWSLYRNWRTVKNNRPVVVLLVIILALFFVYALGVANFGTAIRHRAKVVPILLILAAGLPELRRRQKRWASRARTQQLVRA